MAYKVVRGVDSLLRSLNLQPGHIGVATDTGVIFFGTGNTVTDNAFFDPALVGGVSDLDSLSDVTLTAATAGHALMHSGAEFVNRLLVGADISDYNAVWDARLAGKTTANLTEGANLYYTDTRFDTRFGQKNIGDLFDVTSAGANVGDHMEWNGTGWEPGAPGGGVGDINDLGDVVITAVVGGHALIYDGANFVNQLLVAANISDYATAWDTRLGTKSTTNLAEGTNLYYTDVRADTRADGRIALASVDDFADVDTTTGAPSSNDVLAWNGVNWVPATPVSDLSGLSDVTITAATVGEVLIHNGAAFVDRLLVGADISDYNAVWDTRAAASSVDALADVDTTTATPSVTNVLTWDGANWVPGAGGGVSVFTGLTDAPANYTGAANKFVKVNATPNALEFIAAGLSDLVDADMTGVVQFDIMQMGGSGAFLPMSHTVGNITDVDLTGIVDNVGLIYNIATGKWEVEEALTVDSTGVANTNLLAYELSTLTWKPVAAVAVASDLTDINTTSPGNGSILMFNFGAGEWQDQDPAVVLPTIYSTDGTLGGTRTLTCANNTLAFEDCQRFSASFKDVLGAGDAWHSLDSNGLQVYAATGATGGPKTALRCFDVTGLQGGNVSAIFMASSTTKGSLPAPRMTAAQLALVATPATGLLAYQTDGASGYYEYDGAAWVKLGSAYRSTFVVATWSGDAITITAATHKQGTNPRTVQVWEDLGSTHVYVLPQTISINESTGDVTITVGAGLGFDGSISISA